MRLKDLEEWRKDFPTWRAFAKHLGYGVRHVEKIRNKETPIPAKVELQWLREKKDA